MKILKLSLAIALAVMMVACTNADRKSFNELLPKQQSKCPVALDIPAKLTGMEYTDYNDALKLTFEVDESRWNLAQMLGDAPGAIESIIALQLPMLDSKLDSIFRHFVAAGSKTRVDYELVGNQLATNGSGTISHDKLMSIYLTGVSADKLSAPPADKLHMQQAAAWLETSGTRPWELAEGIALVGGGLDTDSLTAQVMIDAEKYAPTLLETEGFAQGVIKTAIIKALMDPNSPIANSLKLAQAGMTATVTATFDYFHIHHSAQPTATLENISTWMGKVQPTTHTAPVDVNIAGTEWQ